MLPKTYYAKPGEVQGTWRLIDASGIPLGRLSSAVAVALMGKDKPTYTRHADTGDHVIVVNAKKVLLTGSKEQQKNYYSHSNYPGGLKTYTAEALRKKRPERLVQLAVHGMLPKGHMGRRWFKKLRVFGGEDHPHQGQNPQVVDLKAALTESNQH